MVITKDHEHVREARRNKVADVGSGGAAVEGRVTAHHIEARQAHVLDVDATAAMRGCHVLHANVDNVRPCRVGRAAHKHERDAPGAGIPAGVVRKVLINTLHFKNLTGDRNLKNTQIHIIRLTSFLQNHIHQKNITTHTLT